MEKKPLKLKVQFATFLWRASICLAPNFVWLIPNNSVGWSAFVSAMCVALFAHHLAMASLAKQEDFNPHSNEAKTGAWMFIATMCLIVFGVTMAI